MPLAVSTAPSFIHVMVVAGEPEEVQLRVNRVPETMLNDVIDTGAVCNYVIEIVTNRCTSNSYY